MVTLGGWIRPDGTLGGTPDQQTGTFMHELGHTLGLDHGGADHVSLKPNYFSVMNYHWQVPHKNTGWRLDYSRQQLPTVDENNLNEAVGFGYAVGGVEPIPQVHVGPTLSTRVPLAGPGDLSGDGDSLDSGLAIDLNADGLLGPLEGHNDWANQRYSFRDTPSFADGTHQGEEDTLTSVDYSRLYEVLEDDLEPNDGGGPGEAVDLGSADTLIENVTLHDANDEDWFRWTPAVTGIVGIILQQAQDVFLGLELFLVGVATSDYVEEDYTPESQYIRVPVVEDQTYQIKVSSPAGLTGYYQLRIDAPEVWDGDDAQRGLPGDGRSWNSAELDCGWKRRCAAWQR